MDIYLRQLMMLLKMATGDFVALMDDDDLLTPDALYKVVSVLNKK